MQPLPMQRRNSLDLALVCALVSVTSAACGGGGPGPIWLDDVEADPPASLSDVGIFDDLAARSPASGVVAYEPRWPLWSSGAGKQRMLFVPGGKTIDTG